MKNRVLGFSGLPSPFPVILIHENTGKDPLVNGRSFKIRVAGPGGKTAEGELLIRLSNPAEMDTGDFISFAGGVLLQKLQDPSGASQMTVANQGFLSVSSIYEIWPQIKTGVLTVSDKGSRGQRVDTSGPALESAAITIGAWATERSLVPDEVSSITEVLNEWIFKRKLDLILVTGGTGLSPRDVTPEALMSLAGREVPGIAEYMRWKTSFQNERSIISRSVAVTCEKTLLISLPGSEKGSVQCFNAVAPVLRHAIEILSGRGTDCGKPH